MVYMFIYLKALQINTGGKGKGRQLTFAKQLLCLMVFTYLSIFFDLQRASLVSQTVKASAYNAGDQGLIPG